MKNLFLTLLALLIPTTLAIAQDVKPSPTPLPAEDNEIVKISTNLIQIDVTVTGKDGKIISDLKPEDFEIFENGQKQDISHFSFVSSGAARNEPGPKTQPSDVPSIPGKVRPDQIRRTIALVVDDLTLSFESTSFVKRALRNFVEKQMEDGDLVAIIRTGAGIGALQQFTNDKRMLYAAIEKIRWNALGAGGISAFASIDSNSAAAAGNEDDEDAAETDQAAEMNQFRETIFATGTLGAVNYVVRGMKDLPGRKSVMLLSDGFSIFSQTTGGFRDSTRVLDALKLLVDMANRSSVVVYTLDARGLVYTGLTAADSVSGLSAAQIERQIAGRRDRLFDTQEGLIFLAKETGGLSFINNNDISGGIRKVLEDQSFYLIGYQPDAETFDPEKRRFNKLEIKVKRSGANVRYRSGFFGVSDEDIQPLKNLTGGQRLMQALSSPFAVSEINLSLNTLFRADAGANPSLSSFVHIDLKDLKFVDTPTGKKAVFDIIAVNFGDNGLVLDELGKSYTIEARNDVFEQMLKDKFVYFFNFPVKKPGAFQMRVAIRDHTSEKLGSASQFVDVPKLSNNRLTISGLVLENLTAEQWNAEAKTNEKQITDPRADTAIRIFKRGTILRYGFEVYNSKSSAGQMPQLSVHTRVFRDGKMIHEGKPSPMDLSAQKDPKVIYAAGALSLGTSMQPGDYVLQVIVADSLAKKKYKTAVQVVQFEVQN